MGHCAAMAGDDHFLTCFNSVQQFAQMSLRPDQIDAIMTDPII
jgi:hypothetical protein